MAQHNKHAYTHTHRASIQVRRWLRNTNQLHKNQSERQTERCEYNWRRENTRQSWTYMNEFAVVLVCWIDIVLFCGTFFFFLFIFAVQLLLSAYIISTDSNYQKQFSTFRNSTKLKSVILDAFDFSFAWWFHFIRANNYETLFFNFSFHLKRKSKQI